MVRVSVKVMVRVRMVRVDVRVRRLVRIKGGQSPSEDTQLAILPHLAHTCKGRGSLDVGNKGAPRP